MSEIGSEDIERLKFRYGLSWEARDGFISLKGRECEITIEPPADPL